VRVYVCNSRLSLSIFLSRSFHLNSHTCVRTHTQTQPPRRCNVTNFLVRKLLWSCTFFFLPGFEPQNHFFTHTPITTPPACRDQYNNKVSFSPKSVCSLRRKNLPPLARPSLPPACMSACPPARIHPNISSKDKRLVKQKIQRNTELLVCANNYLCTTVVYEYTYSSLSLSPLLLKNS